MILESELDRMVEEALLRVLENLSGETKAMLGLLAAEALNENRQAQGRPALEL